MTTQAVQTKTFPCSSVIQFSSLPQTMNPEDELNDLRVQFQELQKQQEKRKVALKKKKAPDKFDAKSILRDDLNLLQQGFQGDNVATNDK